MVPVREIERQLAEVMAAFDVALVPVADAQELLGSFTAIARMAEAGQLACAKRVADTTVARTPRDRDGRRWAGRRLGVSDGQAARLLELADQLDQLPATKDAFQAGRLSKEQAAEIARTASEVPNAEATLLQAAERESLGELKRRGQRVRAGAESAEARHRRLHERRYLRTWTDTDGAGRGSWSLPPERHAELLAALAPLREQTFADARAQGRREPAEAYDADALLHMARHATAHHDDGADPSPGSDGDSDGNGSDHEAGSEGTGPPVGGGQRRAAPSTASGARVRRRKNPFTRRMKVIVRIDKTALDRGTVADGEVCEVDGVGPVPVAAVREWIGDDAFVAAVLTDGTDVLRAVHLGRSPTALQQTVLDWQQGGCQVLGCSNRIALEIDHTEDWARTRHTTLGELDRLCPHHHCSRPTTAGASNPVAANAASSHPTVRATRPTRRGSGPERPSSGRRSRTRSRAWRSNDRSSEGRPPGAPGRTGSPSRSGYGSPEGERVRVAGMVSRRTALGRPAAGSTRRRPPRRRGWTAAERRALGQPCPVTWPRRPPPSRRQRRVPSPTAADDAAMVKTDRRWCSRRLSMAAGRVAAEEPSSAT